MSLPLVAIVGRPNVGKSTLYNKFVGGRPALVHDTPGLTRDRRYGVCDYFGQEFRVVDTGGLDPEAESDVIGAGIHRQAERAIAEAEAILFVVDGKSGVSPLDADLGRKLRTLGKPLLLVVNKIDHPNHDAAMHEFHRLGFPEVFPVSATHGRGVDELMERLVAVLALPPAVRLTEEELAVEERAKRGEPEYDAEEEVEDDEELDAEEGEEGEDEADAEDDSEAVAESEGESETDSDSDAESESDDEDEATADDESDADPDSEEDAAASDEESDDEDEESDDEDEESDDEDEESDDEDEESEDEDEESDDEAAPAAAAASGEKVRRGAWRREPKDPNAPLRIAFVGRPNAGKSSLCNRLIGEERSLVHHVAGTTTDPVDSELTLGNRRYILVDTAGIRRKAKVDIEIEKIAVSMALGQIERADVVVLMIDASTGPSEQDARLAGMVEERGKAIVLAINKADLVPSAKKREALTEAITDNFHFLPWAPVVWLSAARGDGVDRLLDKVDQVAKQYNRRIKTSDLNRFFAEVCEAMPPPIWRGKSARVYYLTQGRSAPPTFLLWTNNAEGLPPTYRRFVSNRLRDRYGFLGTPLRVISKAKSKGEEDRGYGNRSAPQNQYEDRATRPPRPGERTAPKRRVRPAGPDAAPPSSGAARATAGRPARPGGARTERPAGTRGGVRKVRTNKAGQPGGVKMGRSGTPRSGKPGRAVAGKPGRAAAGKPVRPGAAKAGVKRPGLSKAGRPSARVGSRRGTKR